MPVRLRLGTAPDATAPFVSLCAVFVQVYRSQSATIPLVHTTPLKDAVRTADGTIEGTVLLSQLSTLFFSAPFAYPRLCSAATELAEVHSTETYWLGFSAGHLDTWPSARCAHFMNIYL